MVSHTSRLVFLLLLPGIILPFARWGGHEVVPEAFATYYVKPERELRPVRPHFLTGISRGLRDQDPKFREAVSAAVRDTGVNFAGHFILVQASCGTSCFSIVVVDARSGSIFEQMPFGEVLADPWFPGSPLSFRADSRLLVADGFFGEPSSSNATAAASRKYERLYLLWLGDRFSILERRDIKAPIKRRSNG